jgi:hypothetical protein
MIRDSQLMRCGSCAGERVRIYLKNEASVFAECCTCKSVTEIVASKPVIEFQYPRETNSEGILAVF